MNTKSIPIENQNFPRDDYTQDSFNDVAQDSGGGFNQHLEYDKFAQHEVPEIVNQHQQKK